MRVNRSGMHGNQVLFPVSTMQVERLLSRYAEAAACRNISVIRTF